MKGRDGILDGEENMGNGGKVRGRGNWRPGGGGAELRSRPSLAAVVGGGTPATRPSKSRESCNKVEL